MVGNQKSPVYPGKSPTYFLPREALFGKYKAHLRVCIVLFGIYRALLRIWRALFGVCRALLIYHLELTISTLIGTSDLQDSFADV